MGTITSRQRNRPVLLLTLLLLAGCGGQFSQGPGSGLHQNMLEGLPDLASLSAIHSPSIAYNETLLGIETHTRSGSAVANGDMLELPSGPDALCWAIWRWDAAGHDITGVSFDLDLPAGNVFYIALADYSTGSWEIHGPNEAVVQFPPADGQFPVDPARNISPAGMLYCAALTWDGDSATVRSVRLSIETGSDLNEAEDNNTLSDANQLPPLPFEDWRGHAGPPGAGGDPYDYYSFKAVDGQLVTISLSYNNAAANLRLSLYDTDQTVMVSADDGNPGLRVIRRGLLTGTYWLRVQAYSGESDYTLSISIETPGYDEVEDNDGFNTAQPLALPVTEFLGSCGPEGYNGDDLDYYSFTAAEGDLLSAGLDYASASANLYLRLYNEARATVVFDEAGNDGSRSLSWGLNAGTYYIRVSAFSGTADYTLALSLTHPGFDEVEDNDSFAGAQMLSLPVASFSGNAGEAGYDGDDYDYYAFSAAEGDQLSASLGYDNTQANLYLRLYSPGETTISSDEAGNPGSRSLSWGLSAGTHYLSVRAYSGMSDYALNVSLSHPGYAESEDNDSFSGADPLSPPVLNWLGSVGSGGYDGDLADYYSFTAAEGQLVTITLGYSALAGNLSLRLYGTDQMTIFTDAAGNTGSRSLSWGLKAGVNYVRVYAESGSADYQLSLSLSTPGYDETEDNDARDEADILPAFPISNWFGSAGAGSYDGDNSDYSTFTLAAPATLNFHLEYDSAGGDDNLLLYVQNAAGSNLASDTSGNPGFRDVSFSFLPGSYYVRVQSTQGNSEYTLDISP